MINGQHGCTSEDKRQEFIQFMTDLSRYSHNRKRPQFPYRTFFSFFKFECRKNTLHQFIPALFEQSTICLALQQNERGWDKLLGV